MVTHYRMIKRFSEKHLMMWSEMDRLQPHRMIYFVSCLALIHFSQILYAVLLMQSRTIQDHVWMIRSLSAHGMILIWLAIAYAASAAVKRFKPSKRFCSIIMEAFTSLLTLFFGVIVTSLDQHFAPSLTPFILTCFTAAVTLNISPYFATIQYSIIYACFYFFIAWYQKAPEIVLSFRLNGLIAVMVSFSLTYFIWKNHRMRIEQGKLIERQRSRLERKNKRLAVLAARDPLTGLYNRAQFMQYAQEEIYRTRKPVSLIIMDIDYFKVLNDTYGHPAGDYILKETSRVLTSLLRSTDKIARLGGEEFIILLPDTKLENAVKVAEKIRLTLQKHAFHFRGTKMTVTASLGVTQMSRRSPDAISKGYDLADQALYKAKNNGRNRVEIA